MKNLTFLTAILCLFLFTFSCTDTNTSTDESATTEETVTPAAEEMGVPSAPNTVDTINLNTFELWKGNWASNGAAWLKNNTLTAFNLPKVDLTEVLNENPDSTRFYLGLQNENGTYVAKIMVVGVKAGQDMLNYSKGEYVYDLSDPCPPYCE